MVEEEEAERHHDRQPKPVSEEEEGHIQPRRLLGDRMTHPWVEPVAAKEERDVHQQGDREERTHPQGDPFDDRTPADIADIVDGCKDHSSLGQSGPEEEVDQVDLPCSDWLLCEDTQQEGEQADCQGVSLMVSPLSCARICLAT